MSAAAADLSQPLEVRRVQADSRRGPPLPRKVAYEEGDVGGVRCVIARPKGKVPQAHIVYMHGGGYSMGLVRAYRGFSGLLARGAAAEVLAVDYRLSPEHPYPAAVEDCLAVYRTLIQTVDHHGVVIAGDSAGGGAALSALCRLRDRGEPCSLVPTSSHHSQISRVRARR
jgi:acetyl esterase/lipase